MPRNQHAVRDVAWQIVSVAVRTRDGPGRVGQAYRILIGDEATTHRQADPYRGRSPMRSAIYARVSTERQDRQQTIDSQIAALRAWAASNGHELAQDHVYTDEGYTGSRLDRPGLDGLRDAAFRGEFDAVAVLSPDRLARKYAYQVLLLEELRKAGCEVVFLHRAITDDPQDQLLLQIQGAVAEYERAVLGERFRRGKLLKARAGRLARRQGPLRLSLRPQAGRRPRLPRHRRGRGGGGAPALLLADRGADDDPPDRQAAQRRPLAPALGPAAPGRPRSSTASSTTRPTRAWPTPTATGSSPPGSPGRVPRAAARTPAASPGLARSGSRSRCRL